MLDGLEMMTRRAVLARGGFAALALSVGGALALAQAREARAAAVAPKVFEPSEMHLLERLGDVLLPGAAEAGIAHFVDDQLASAAPLILLRYLDFPMDFTAFYRGGLAALEALAMTRHRRGFGALETSEQAALVSEIARGNPPDWEGPPAPLFFFVTRSDAVDVVYGTLEGFSLLELPYQAHIVPQRPW